MNAFNFGVDYAFFREMRAAEERELRKRDALRRKLVSPGASNVPFYVTAQKRKRK